MAPEQHSYPPCRVSHCRRTKTDLDRILRPPWTTRESDQQAAIVLPGAIMAKAMMPEVSTCRWTRTLSNILAVYSMPKARAMPRKRTRKVLTQEMRHLTERAQLRVSQTPH